MTREATALIVVGVDGTAESHAALAFALDEAARTGDTVEVVTTWHPAVPPLSYPVAPVDATGLDDELRSAAQNVQQEALERATVPPGVPVWSRVVKGSAGPALV